MMRLTPMLFAGLTLLAAPAFAEGAECPLHARLVAEKTPQAISIAPPIMPMRSVQASESTPPLLSPSPRPSPPQNVGSAERGVDTAPVIQEPVVKEVELKVEPVMAEVMNPAKAYENLLSAHLTPGADGLMLFDYAGVKAAGKIPVIDDYITGQSELNPDNMSAAEATAFWANLYNAVTLQVVLENYPVKSIKEIKSGRRKGPWKRDLVTVNGKTLTLDNIEHDILRKKYASPYIHYMVNCASIGCPNLRPKLWKAETLEADRMAAAHDYIKSSRGVNVTGNKLKLSSIYKWFKGDFGGKSGVLEHIRTHADTNLAAAIDGGAKISGYDYNWSLNE